MGSFVPHGNQYSVGSNRAHHLRDQGWGIINDWEEQAACQNTDIRLWFGEEKPLGDKGPLRTREQTQQAKAICARCPVLDECRQWAMESGIPYGIVAAMSEAERRKLLGQGESAWQQFWRQQDKAMGRPKPMSGNHNGNKTHCRNGHPYSPENTYRSGGKRFCLACQKRRTAEYRVRKRKELGHWPWEDWPSTKQRQNGHLTG
jgi:WhiB family transcriptional regulator, redox-sensing transcriptional regulator